MNRAPLTFETFHAIVPTTPGVPMQLPPGTLAVPAKNGFQCVPGVLTPVRLNAGKDPECMSINGRDCIIASDSYTCDQLAQQSKSSQELVGLSCGNMHKTMFGTTGYQDPHHWCAQSKRHLR